MVIQSFYKLELAHIKQQQFLLFIIKMKYDDCYYIQMKERTQQRIKATPVILIDESTDIANSIAISKVVDYQKQTQLKPSPHFVAGFKYRPDEPTLYQNQSKDNPLLNSFKMDKLTVYDQFQILNSNLPKNKNKEISKGSHIKEVPKQNHSNVFLSNLNSYNPGNAESKNQNYAQIANLKERNQTAMHFKSSLQVINLENIEAKLEAHRMMMKPIEEQYNNIKGKSELNKNEVDKKKLKFDYNLQKQYKNLQPNKVYQLIKAKQEEKSDEIKEAQILQDLWEQKKKKNPKLAEYDFKYQQYLVEKEAKELIGSVVRDKLYTWDKYAKKQELQKRKQARRQKSKQRLYAQKFQKETFAEINKSNDKILPQQAKQLPDDQIANSKDDKFIAKYMMAQIDADKKGMISKEELSDYISRKQHIIKAYHIDLRWLHTDLDNFQTKRKGMLSLNDLVLFLGTLSKLQHPQMILKQINNQSSGTTTLNAISNQVYTSFYKQHMKKFKKVFEVIDINDDRIIKRQEFIQNIYTDADCNRIIDQVVLKFNIIQKTITFRQIITFILDDYLKEKNQKLKKSKQYITLQRFNQYFQIPQNLDLATLDKKKNNKSKKQNASVEIQIFDLQDEYLFLLKDIFDTIPRIYQDFVISKDFVSLALKDPQILALGEELCRIQSVETGLKVQTIKSTLLRMTKECDQYTTWDIIKSYFSRRGRPLDWDFQLIQKKKKVREQKLKNAAQFTKINNFAEEEQRMKSKQSLAINSKLVTKSHSVQKYTIPQPFKITDQIKKDKEKATKLMASQQKQIDEMRNQFKAKPVNKEILESKPNLIQGKIKKSNQKLNKYQYQNYENDRIQRVLKKAQQKFEEQQRMKQIKKLAQVKAKGVEIDLKKKLEDVIKEQKIVKGKSKLKPTTPINTNLYPNVQEEGKKKLQNYKKQLQKQKQAENLRIQKLKDIKERAKEKNQHAKKLAQDKKLKNQEEQKQKNKLSEQNFKPKITKYQPSQDDQKAANQAKEKKRKKKEQQVLNDGKSEKYRKRIDYEKKDKKLNIENMQLSEILIKFDEIDFADLLLLESQKKEFCKQFDLKQKTSKECLQKFSGISNRQKGKMLEEQKRIDQQKKYMKEQKQELKVKQTIKEAKQKCQKTNGNLDIDTNFHRSNALRRYRALMENKVPESEFDKYSTVGKNQNFVD